MSINITVADPGHERYAETICNIMEQAAKVRGTGIAKRAPDYIRQKIAEGKAVIAIDTHNDCFAGFCYIEDWSHGKYIANSGLIVAPDYRKQGIAKGIKEKIFKLSRKKYPEAKIFGITTSLAVMKINSDLGYKPVTFSELTQEEAFWKGCSSCPNYDILNRTDKVHCLCTGMLYEPGKQEELQSKKDRWIQFKRFMKLQKAKIKRKTEHLFNLI
ncbi:GNAT family N-acetyltransferase [Balneolaceae bacterium YR4-1]|uniref:GNAT family N-acetyltransferase n=1 Tax=Halalkalibaculum roseum TaxID=2709311 RepID=A0A6M1SVS4_9BACT|nr:GNAT family N-acetyltransferase [Halalkalibaculum roseum]NGP77080.1 GNAT family N-acetyltransferase [Halalkalibaculum roseum]